jgi:hypothetical protein
MQISSEEGRYATSIRQRYKTKWVTSNIDLDFYNRCKIHASLVVLNE